MFSRALLVNLLLCAAALAWYVPTERKTSGAKRRGDEAAEKRLATMAALDATVRVLTFDQTALEAALAEIAKTAGVTVKPDWVHLEAAGVKRQTPVSARVRNVKAAKALQVVLDSVGDDAIDRRTFYIDDRGHVVVTTQTGDIAANTVERNYDVSDLVVVIPGREPAAEEDERKTVEELAEEVITLVKETVDPESWVDHGGKPGTIVYDKGLLKVKQLKENHRQLANLLEQLRETRRPPGANDARADVIPENAGVNHGP